MKTFFKKYWSHILNIFCMGFVDCLICFLVYTINNEEMMEGTPTVMFPVLLIAELVLTLLVFGEMIYAIVVAAKDNELKNKAFHIIGAYFLNIFYIPCFLLSCVHKDKNATN